MEQLIYKEKPTWFYRLKIAQKKKITAQSFILELNVPADLQSLFVFQSGQYVSLCFQAFDTTEIRDYSITSAPHEGIISLAIKIPAEDSVAAELYKNYNINDEILVSAPAGRFTLISKPSEFRTIVCFAAGIGITPIFSHIKHILFTEPRTRLFLFFGNTSREEVIFDDELQKMQQKYKDRLQIFYFYSQERTDDPLYFGRLDARKLALIINQILHLDDTDEESTIWDAVDEVLICGHGEMIKSLANACYQHGIRKKNIHFELFEAFNDNIYPLEQEFPLIENVQIDFQTLGKNYKTALKNNREKVLQQLIAQKFPVPYSCKSGICGTCICTMEEGEVDLLENEYLTEKEAQEGKILPCMSIAKTPFLKLNFDLN